MEVDIQIIGQAEFPELVGDILACIGCSAITFYDNLVTYAITLVGLHFSVTERNDPAACCFARLRML